MSSVIELIDISKTYKTGEEVTPFHNMNFSMKPGEFVALTGESGCGKSTMLNLAGGILEPTQGTLLYDGRDYWKMTDRERTRFRAQNIGFLFQSSQLVRALTVWENMELSARISGIKMEKDIISECLEHYGLSEKKNSLPQRLSGGQRRRAMLATVMLRKPKLILADEPTNDLDEKWIDRVMEDFRSWSNEGSAILMATHNQKLIKKALKCYHIENRRIEEMNYG